MNGVLGRTLKGQTKSIAVEDDAVTISYRALYHGFKGDKRIPFSSITAVQFREPGSWLAGYIQFSIKGGCEWAGPVNQDENALQFDSKDADDFRALRDFVQGKIATLDPNARPISMADELAKLAALRDQGILTDDEFARQKARLLT
ncbi:MAG TPA: SHOCT domain-containing protein [Sphingomonas sp.]|nr:SHOCT domain-containing protein [Sphingomonas sp.]